MPWTFDIKQQKKGSGYIVFSSNGYDDAYIIFISKIHTIGIMRDGISIQAGDNYSRYSFDISESDRKAVLDFIIEEQRSNLLTNISKETNSRLQSIQTLISAQDKQISANQILLESMLKELTKANTAPTPKKSQIASILKQAGFA